MNILNYLHDKFLGHPKAVDAARRELAAAEYDALQTQSNAEYYELMTQYHHKRIIRLEAYLNRHDNKEESSVFNIAKVNFEDYDRDPSVVKIVDNYKD